MSLSPISCAGALLMLGLARATADPAGPVDFKRDIEPVLQEHCVKCHGAEKQKGGLRLDAKVFALRGGDDGQVIVPGKADESKLIHLVTERDKGKFMPSKGERLHADQIVLLKTWIDQGAIWPDDGKVAEVRSDLWSLQPVKKPAGSGIDDFIAARLQKEGLTFAPEADRSTLIRRLSFDLTGLPPTPEEVRAFLADASPQAYENLVDRLLASPHYGERWGRHWLDVARFTESQGFEYDRPRDNAWHYRDYVIKSFNDDKPYDRFMKEQVAGDTMAPLTSEGMIGPSLLVCGPWDEAGNAQANPTQKMITREDELEDLLGVVGQSFLGLTVNCARCHAHKFDPIPHEDYYRMKSVFEGVKHGERMIEGTVESKDRQDRKQALEKQLAVLTEQIAQIDAEGARLAVAKQPQRSTVVGPVAMLRWKFDDAQLLKAVGKLQGSAIIERGRLQLRKDGDFFVSEPLSRDIREKTLEAWLTLATLNQAGGAAISLESANGSIFDAIVFAEKQPKKWMLGSNNFSRTRELEVADETAAPNELIHVVAVYRADNSLTLYRNGAMIGKTYQVAELPTFAAGDAHVLLGKRHTGASNGQLTGEIQQAALYDRALSDAEVLAAFQSGGSTVSQQALLAALGEDQRTARQAALQKLQGMREELNGLKPIALGKSYVGTRIQPEPTKRLVRGNVNQPAEVVSPGALSAITALKSDFGLPADAPEAQRRLMFSEWLASPKNPLPARVMANRIWHLHFGQGLVSTPNDFGVNGMPPSHPELLDWLAATFIENGWSVKALHRLIVNSRSYRQSGAFNRKAAAVDADNQLLWRFAPRRLEAEAVRDAMLSASGEINLQRGGPSFQGNTYVENNKEGAPFNRRSVYRMNINSGKDPLLDAFDCPDPAVKTPRRGVTITPLQALELMNNAFVQRQAKLLAERVLKSSGNDVTAAIQLAYQLVLSRPPSAEEAELAQAAAKERDFTSVCWALLNSTEFLYVK